MEQAKHIGIKQLFILTEDLSRPASPACSASVAPLPGYWEKQTPFIVGHIVEFVDANSQLCVHMCNQATLLKHSMFSMGEALPLQELLH
jgi:hypothetical protein